MNNVLRAILDYTRTRHTDYALLITGPWGCGKTYFWKNVVERELRQVRCGSSSWRPLYASLYGCRSAKDIDTQLFLAAYPHLRKKWAARLSTVGGHVLKQIAKLFTGLELPAIDLRWLVNTKRAVLCFDDLERTEIPMKEALGYINVFVEHESVKTIILTNEDAISEEEDKATYTAMKEKLVGASLAFRPKLDTVFASLINEHEPGSAFHAFLLQNGKLLRDLFDRSGTENIRSLRRAIAVLAVVFDALRAEDVDPNAVATQLVYAVAPGAFELHGRRADRGWLRDLLCMEHMFAAGMSLSDVRPEKSDEEKYKEEFAERYVSHLGLAEWNDAVGCPPICEFLLTGVLDRRALVAWAENLTRPPDEREERIKRLSYDVREMEDEEFLQVASQVLREVEAGEIAAVGRYVGLYRSFEWFVEMNLIPLTREELVAKFTDGLGKALGAGTLEANQFLRHEIDHPAIAPTTEEDRSFRQRVLEANEAALGRGVRERVQDSVSRHKADPGGFMRALLDEGESGLRFQPVFQELDVADTAAWVLGLPNRLKTLFSAVLQRRYERHTYPAELAVELPVLRGLRDRLDTQRGTDSAAKTPKPISVLVLQGIVSALGKAIERLEQQQREAPGPGGVEHPPQED